MVSKKELVLRAFRGEEVDRVPVGFWFHFVSQEEKMLGLDNPVIFNKSVEGHTAYVRAARPDFVKIMSDGFFKYPSTLYSDYVESIRDLSAIQSIGEEHPWIEQQIEMVKAVKESYPENLASFYNIFAPVSYLKRWFRRDGSRGDREIADFLAEDSELTRHILDVIAGDIAILTRRIIEEAALRGFISVPSKSKTVGSMGPVIVVILSLVRLRSWKRPMRLAVRIFSTSAALKGPAMIWSCSKTIQLKSLTGQPIMRESA